ncbi:hypothetical protein CAPTEDRAFT_127669 [Capitella teleta]|uniref:MRH domain-containing protein n=1 Tax=Capitella teleta TaxID=283909 RepID=R7V2M8_CAPTE|nr:hypothetical protein CAPTEDRAFT_127669 [Capitella teleta]|eukprot:ELU12794.1 hypothetical protein CAPTEDRAFT_127669 [Capitella teleta]
MIGCESALFVNPVLFSSSYFPANFISLEYESGDEYSTHCKNEPRRSIIMIICKEGETQGIFRLVGENNNKTQDCFYLFELEHKAACMTSASEGLSIGSIVCIVFFSLLACYLLGGFIYQRFVVGAKGMEQIPNYSFWQDFGNLQADGCDLIFRSRKGVGPRQYRGIGDEQLQSQEEVSERDDHLLPM